MYSISQREHASTIKPVGSVRRSQTEDLARALLLDLEEQAISSCHSE
jgi:hypothetical protein